MSGKIQYDRVAGLKEAEDSEDDDLSLDELDPAAAATARHSNDGPRNPRAWRGNYGSPSGLGGRIHLQKLRTTGVGSHKIAHRKEIHGGRVENEEIEDDRALLDDVSAARPSAASSGEVEDSAPLLSPSDADPQDFERPVPRPRRKGSLSNLLAKFRSTPQSEAEGEYGPGHHRTIRVGRRQNVRYPPNIVSNAKYTPWSFLPRTLYHEFSFFLNMYFLLVALSQIIPALRIGYLSTYIAPLAFVIMITLGKEAFDDITRRRRDAEANSERYSVLIVDGEAVKKSRGKLSRSTSYSSNQSGRGGRSSGRLSDAANEEADIGNPLQKLRSHGLREVSKTSRDLKVGDVIALSKDRRLPADCVVLKTFPGEIQDESSQDGGETFIRTDQLDGETDWKLRLAPTLTQGLSIASFSNITLNASKPERNVNEFVGSLTLGGGTAGHEPVSVPLNIDNTAWANTVIASSGTAVVVVVYTGHQTRQALSTSSSRTKTGLLERELNSQTKILCFITLLLSLLLAILEDVEAPNGQRYKWYVAAMRFLILFSTIVPISLRVNLDLGKSVYAWFIHRDEDMPGALVRTSTIPEDLGRIEYLLSDKTGTITQNDMQLRKIHIGTVSYANDAMTEVATYVRQGFSGSEVAVSKSFDSNAPSIATATRSRRDVSSRVCDVVLALALCHNVTPTTEEEEGKTSTNYQASSPDEIAIVRWTEQMGLKLSYRDRKVIALDSTYNNQRIAEFQILDNFPFTSESKRMGIVVRLKSVCGETKQNESADHVWFFQKGADTVMSQIVASNDWLDEETANMAREGLRTLVIGRKRLSQQQYEAFANKYREASLSLQDRDNGMAMAVKEYLENDLELLGVTGIEDKLQQDVKPSLELLRNAGVKIWMLTGDKVETARCVAVSSKLVARGQYIHTVTKLSRKDAAQETVDFLRSKPDSCLLIDGESLALMLGSHRIAFITAAVRLPAVIACRCSPTQKAEVAQLIRHHTKKRVCCIGDGGNDVSMIQAADVGVGIVGKEGKQASLAADFSILQFHHLTKLLMWHGRNSYKRSAKLAQFVIHRGLIISVCQTVYSIASKFEPNALYRDWLLVGYATVYTMMPVFSLTLDTDIPPQLAHLYPELYAELSSNPSLSYKTFFIWVGISIYQGCAIQILCDFLIGSRDSVFQRMVSVSFTVLIINELVMVAAEVTTWHWIMIVTILGTTLIYFGSVPFLDGYFDLAWVLRPGFWWRVALISAISLIPVYSVKIARRLIKPPNYRKVQQGL